MLKTINLNQEWDFIVTEINGEKPSKGNLIGREMLLIMQILLGGIALVTKAKERYLLRKNYLVLKRAYCTKRFHS